MTNRHYLFVFGDPEGSNLHSYQISRNRILTWLLMGFVGLCLISFGMSTLFTLFRSGLQSRELREENRRLTTSIREWQTRMQSLESSMKELEEKNNQIRMTAGLTTPDIEFGVGGKAMPPLSGAATPEVSSSFASLQEMDARIQWLEMNTDELSKALQTRSREISHYPSIRPVRGGWISSLFGKRKDPFTGVDENHPGLDISIRPESEIMATGAGVVRRINNRVIKNKGYGRYIIVDHGFGYETLYAHLSEIFVTEGQQIKRWDLIGLSGNSGKSTAPHLHYGVYYNGVAQDPGNFILE